MRKLLPILLAGCVAKGPDKPLEPPPVYTPRPIPTAIPEPEPIPEPSPTPEPEVTMPAFVKVGQPFVVQYCGPEFMENVSILFDGKYPAGGLMGWQNGCKRQTITGLNTSGTRFFQFVVDGETQPEKYQIIVE